MKKILVALVCAVLLVGCGGKPAAPSAAAPTAAPSVASTAASTASTAASTAASAVTPTNTPLAVIPTNAPNCSNSAAFEADVTVPDNTPFNAGETFTKVWRVRNNGSCAWTQGYALVFANGEEMDAPDSIPLPYTPPNETAEISVDLAAPARDGAFLGNFELRDGNNVPIPVDGGKYLWVSIIVGKTVAVEIPTLPGGSVPTAAPTAANAPCAYTLNPAFVSQALALINSQRAANGLAALVLNVQLTAAAQSHAADMACHNFLSHVGSDGSNVGARVTAAGYSYSVALENIYAQPPQYGGTPDAAVQWWMSDFIHRAAILNDKVTEIGVGYAFYDKSQLDGYWSVVFAAP